MSDKKFYQNRKLIPRDIHTKNNFIFNKTYGNDKQLSITADEYDQL